MAPSKYRTQMPPEQDKVDSILATAVATNLLFDDSYEPFVEKRAADLTAIAKALCGS